MDIEMTNPIHVVYATTDDDAPVSRVSAAKLLRTSTRVLGRGIAGQVLEPITIRSVGRLLDTPVLEVVQVGSVDVPVLRPQLARPDTSQDPRTFYGWDGSAGDTALLAGIDRWWTESGKDSILAAAGFLVVVGTVAAAVVEVNPDPNSIRWDGGRMAYDAVLAGRLDPYRQPRLCSAASKTYQRLAADVLGKRILGGDGGNFVRIT